MGFQDPQSALNPRRRVASIVTQAIEAAGNRESGPERLERARELLSSVWTLGWLFLPLGVLFPPERLCRIVVRGDADPRDRGAQERFEALTEGLKAKGWVEGRNLKIEIRWAGDDDRRIRDYAADLAELTPELLIGTDRDTAKAL